MKRYLARLRNLFGPDFGRRYRHALTGRHRYIAESSSVTVWVRRDIARDLARKEWADEHAVPHQGTLYVGEWVSDIRDLHLDASDAARQRGRLEQAGGLTCPECNNTTIDPQQVADRWCPWCVDYTHGTIPDWLREDMERRHES